MDEDWYFLFSVYHGLKVIRLGRILKAWLTRVNNRIVLKRGDSLGAPREAQPAH